MSARAVWASSAGDSRGRQHDEGIAALRGGMRDAFQRDRDRIVHSISFRRLRHKTQVFLSPDGDHFRVRLTHSLEVAQIGRTIARALGLNEDLTEALCLAHDIGHPPFGHAGEDALAAALTDDGGFDHNGHTLVALTRLECPYPGWPGLNLSWETLEGLAKHNGPVTRPGRALAAVDRAWPLDLERWPSLEAQVAALADDIAYDAHDIDDGLRAGLLTLDQLDEVPMVARTLAAVRARWPGARPSHIAGEMTRAQIGLMVADLIDETRARIAAAAVDSADAARAAPGPLAAFSESMSADERVLKSFMYTRLYHHPLQLAAADMARGLIARLFAAYRADPASLPAEWRATLPDDPRAQGWHIADFIAGMTDRYAIARHVELVGPVALPDAF